MPYNKKLEGVIIDLALKGVEDLEKMWEKQHELVHVAGGSCQDATITRIVSTFITYEAIKKRLPQGGLEQLQPLIDKASAKLEGILAEKEAEALTAIGGDKEELDELVKTLVSKLLGIPIDEIEIEIEDSGVINELPTPTRKGPTRH